MLTEPDPLGEIRVKKSLVACLRGHQPYIVRDGQTKAGMSIAVNMYVYKGTFPVLLFPSPVLCAILRTKLEPVMAHELGNLCGGAGGAGNTSPAVEEG